MSKLVDPIVWGLMSDKEQEDFLNNPINPIVMPAQPKPMSDRDRLAEKLYLKWYENGMNDVWYKTRTKHAIEAASIFFDTLENNNEDE